MASDTLDIVNPLDYKEWDDWVARLPGAVAFHSSHWARVLHEAYGYRPAYFTNGPGNGSGVLVPVMEIASPITGKRGVSLPFSDECKALLPHSANNDAVRDMILDYGRKRGWGYVEFRDDTLFPRDTNLFCSFYSHHIDLKVDMDQHRKSLKHSTRTGINKAVKSGVRFSTRRTPEAMEVFYRLNCITRKKHGLPPQPLVFFRKVQEHMMSNDVARVTEATYEGETVAAAVCFHFGKDVLVKYIAHDEKYQSLRPNNLLVWETIRLYANEGYERLSFGRSDMTNEGLRRFKVGWNLTETELRYHKYDLKREQCVQSSGLFERRGEFLMNKVPIPLLRVLGRVLYKHIG